TDSYHEFATGRFLPRAFMKYGWDLYAPDEKTRNNPYVSPLRARQEQLTGLPPALVITAENDPLRDEGEAYAHKLMEAGVRVTATRYDGMIHDFVLLNGLREVSGVQSALAQASDAIRDALGHGSSATAPIAILRGRRFITRRFYACSTAESLRMAEGATVTNIAINGLGRIGRAFLKTALTQQELRIVAVNDLIDPENLVYLMRFDSAYGRYDQPVTYDRGDEPSLRVGRTRMRLLCEREPARLPWKKLGVDIVIEATGVFATFEKARAHLTAGRQRGR